MDVVRHSLRTSGPLGYVLVILLLSFPGYSNEEGDAPFFLPPLLPVPTFSPESARPSPPPSPNGLIMAVTSPFLFPQFHSMTLHRRPPPLLPLPPELSA